MEHNRLEAPGACDNGAGVVGLLAIAAALESCGVQLPCDLLFAGNVGEEGDGDLRGMRYLYGASPWRERIGANVVLDGAGCEVVVTQALGSRRFLVTIQGPGGHSWTDAGTPNPIVVLSRAIATMSEVALPASPRTTLNIGTIEGGSSVNSIPERATARFDLRSLDAEQLIRLEVELHRAVEEAVATANISGRSKSPVHFLIERIGDRPAGRLSDESRLLEALHAVDRHLGIRTEQRVASTDANIPLSLGIPALSIGAGGDGGGIHTRGEWYDASGRELALKRILLLLLLALDQLSQSPLPANSDLAGPRFALLLPNDGKTSHVRAPATACRRDLLPRKYSYRRWAWTTATRSGSPPLRWETTRSSPSEMTRRFCGGSSRKPNCSICMGPS